MADKSADAFRTISEVAEWLGTPTHVLRFWESKFSQVKPVKRAGGRRYYRPADMQLLGGIKKLLHEDGMTIKGAQKLLRENGIRYVAAMSQPLDDELERLVTPYTPSQDTDLMEGAPEAPPAPDHPDLPPASGDVLPFSARSAEATDAAAKAAPSGPDLRGQNPAADAPPPDGPARPAQSDDPDRRLPAARGPSDAVAANVKAGVAGRDTTDTGTASQKDASQTDAPVSDGGKNQTDVQSEDADAARDAPATPKAAPDTPAEPPASTTPAQETESAEKPAAAAGSGNGLPGFLHRRDGTRPGGRFTPMATGENPTDSSGEGPQDGPAEATDAAETPVPAPAKPGGPRLTLRAEAEEDTDEVAQEEPATAPAARRLSLKARAEIPPLPPEDMTPRPGMLSQVSQYRGTPPPQDALAPLVARLAALRDQMQQAGKP